MTRLRCSCRPGFGVIGVGIPGDHMPDFWGRTMPDYE